MANKKDPDLWPTVLKLVAGACALIGIVWAALWYVDKYGVGQTLAPPVKPTADWGIVTDSPIRNNR
nr:hypothetical protein [uncultured Rhodoferax sp.]